MDHTYNVHVYSAYCICIVTMARQMQCFFLSHTIFSYFIYSFLTDQKAQKWWWLFHSRELTRFQFENLSRWNWILGRWSWRVGRWWWKLGRWWWSMLDSGLRKLDTINTVGNNNTDINTVLNESKSGKGNIHFANTLSSHKTCFSQNPLEAWLKSFVKKLALLQVSFK